MKNQFQILIVEDEAPNREALAMLLKKAGYEIQVAASGEEAFERLNKTTFDIVVTDLFLPGINGIEILKRVKKESPDTHVLMITGNASAETAVEAMKEGAFDYITKPINFEKLKLLMAKALEKSLLVAENTYLRQQLRGKYRFENIIGTSLAMQNLFSRMEKVVSTDSTVLILGESGTGKELVAKALHFNGPRREKPFVAINCAAIPADLLESELFGHVKGSFTGAIHDKAGKFEQANGGTILLDEIGTMPLHLQTKLLRVLQEHEIERVGGSKKILLNVRLISATNADLENEVRLGKFREDLYYRLNVIPIQLPALRERREDIALLAHHFLLKNCQELKRPKMTIAPEAMEALENYSWPGNVREMENVMERSVTLAERSILHVEDLPPQFGAAKPQPGEGNQGMPSLSPKGIDMERYLAGLELHLIREALKMANGVKARAAKLLGIKRTTLVEKLKRATGQTD
ncbi:MAG: sigma-54-dependent Fis family transcriptional regulator [Desulfuromonadaceae bacterium]|nr:sigma-54-dependent Fis family transcriptional regulator [Desulfuromonadaceae bacterium]